MNTAVLASIPSPSEGVWHLGPVPLRAYALCIVAGIVVAILLGQRRWVARGGHRLAVGDIAIWAVPFGIVGSRIYHVITDNQLYFGEGRDPWDALEIWSGGIGIWGAIAGGALGVWIACRRKKIPFPAMADALVPGVILAQAIGRWGNWFNQELFGKPTDLPWGLEITNQESLDSVPEQYADATTFHPTFLYESLWALFLCLLLIWIDKRFTVGHGRLLALYVMGYTLGRAYFESLRIDPANEFFDVRVNIWVSGGMFLLALLYFVISLRLRPGREDPATLLGTYADAESAEHGSSASNDAAESTTAKGDAAANVDAAGKAGGGKATARGTEAATEAGDETGKANSR